MKNKEKKICECCGAKMVEYTFTFNKGLARCLYLMRNAIEGVEIKNLNMTTSMWTNFQKLKYWNLIEPVEGENGRKGGYWKITRQGIFFLTGISQIPRRVTLYRNKIIGHTFDDMIHYKDATGGYEYREDYKEQIINQIGV